ncbi:hypothetical protein IPA_01720 [Ignicoccus pacificus DSM 13166]|uniref:DUF432 domain-containing protein n=1 Tax=Ignicoccus pacificus DSM 13166 TaxID=940294 RepID=A0A977PL98_9CREN|nr:hypothetical protein IPA_01720 [Ignicoccus pacificus DSM 13166]
MRYFGELTPGLKVSEGRWKVELKCYGNNCYYTRSDEEGVKAERILGPFSRPLLRPTIYGGELAYYLYIHFRRPITLISYSSLNFMIGIPIDVEVVMEAQDEYGRTRSYLIDIIELGDVYYALYGKPERGVLCRYHKAKLGTWNWIKEAQFRIQIVNQTDKTITMNRLVFPTLLPDVYYKPSSHRVWVSPIIALIEGNTALIQKSDEKPPQGFVKNPQTGKLQKWTMIFGL